MGMWRSGGIQVGDMIRLDSGEFEGRLGHGWARGRLRAGDVLVAVQHSGDCFFDYLLLDHRVITVDISRGLRLNPVSAPIGAYTMGRHIGRLSPDDLARVRAGESISIRVPELYETPAATGQIHIRFDSYRELRQALALVPDHLLDRTPELLNDIGIGQKGGWLDMDPERRTVHLMTAD